MFHEAKSARLSNPRMLCAAAATALLSACAQNDSTLEMNTPIASSASASQMAEVVITASRKQAGDIS